MTFLEVALLLIVALPLTLVVLGKLRMDLAAILMAVILGIFQAAGAGMLAPAHTPAAAAKAIQGFGQPVVLTLLSLFILTAALDKSGVTRWIARKVIQVGGSREGRLIVLFAVTTAVLSLFMNNLAAGALILPSALEVARRTRVAPSKLLIPVAYGSLLGGAATYFTTANIITSDLLRIANPPQAPLGILDYTPTGALLVVAGVLFLGLFGRRLLPNRQASPEQALARLTGSELEEVYRLNERLWQAGVQDRSTLVGQTVAQADIGGKWGVSVVAIRSNGDETSLPRPSHTIRPGDTLILVGREERVLELQDLGLSIRPENSGGHLSEHGVIFAEVLLAPRSPAEDHTLKEIGFRNRYALTVVALLRRNRSYRTNVGDIPLALGDSLLVVGSHPALQALNRVPDFIVIEPNLTDQPVNLRAAAISITLILSAIAASIAGAPVYLAMLTGAVLVVLLGVLRMEEVYRAIEWQAIFLIAGMYAVSLAMVQTGLAATLGQSVLGLVTPLGPIGVAGGSYLLSSVLTQVMGGQVTALVVAPVTISAAISMGINAQAVAVATATGCSASFFTPLAHPVNILMLAPGSYTFGDFFRIGWRLTIVCFVVLLIGLWLFWGLRF